MRFTKPKSAVKVFNLNNANVKYDNADVNSNGINSCGKSAEFVDSEKRITFELEALPHSKTLFNFALKMMGNKLDADDMVQDTYLRAFRFFDSYEKGTNCKAWLFKILKNSIINKFRKERKQITDVDYDDVMNFIHSIKSVHFEMDDFHQKLYSRLLDDEMISALNSIHNEYMTVVILCDLEGLSYEEISEFLQCPIGTIRSRLHRGRKQLQKKLFEYARQRGYNIEIAA